MFIDNALCLLQNQLAFLVISVPVILNTCSHGFRYGKQFMLFVKILLHVLCKIAFQFSFFITVDKISTYVGV
ncbi:hypothetical protein FDF36_09175 [Bacteroides fragilis]|nr:hypothetical protein [Bacteroides fragilis]